MIHRFLVNNFQSIREDVELDLRIPGTTPEMSCFRGSHSRPDIRLPSVVILVGPNGSGKTALLRAMKVTFRFAAVSYRHHHSDSTGEFIPFLSSETITAPTRIEIEFDVSWLDSGSGKANSLLRYTLVLAREGEPGLPPTVEYEALHAFPKGRPRRVLERSRDEPIYISRELGVRPHDDRLSCIPSNASVISALAEMEAGIFPEISDDIGDVQTNLYGSDPWWPDMETVTRFYQEKPDLLDKVSDQLQRLDLGIGGIQLLQLGDGQWKLVLDHPDLGTSLLLARESAGTRHLVRIFPSLRLVLDAGHLVVTDALDSGFHPDLSAEVLGWFRQERTNPRNAQLICTLQNLSVLDDLEKEEVFIVQKDQHGGTHVHGARDVAGLRRDGNLQKQYRSGSMGGLPVFG